MWHRVYSISGDILCGTQLEKCRHITRCWITGFIVTTAPENSVTQVSFWWCVYSTTFQTPSKAGKYTTRPISTATGRVQFSVRGCQVPSEPSELSATRGCSWRKQRLLQMSSLWKCKELSTPRLTERWEMRDGLRVGDSWSLNDTVCCGRST